MTIGLVFWIIFLICIIFNVWRVYPDWKQGGGSLIVYVLIFLLGWRVFGFIIQG